ncbi:hypothetical protein KAR91_23115 [Candidatus Pacearchaeota archaeon]|nr:hypothetical protein [Candidatus Pacearchaeota archaeon]
MMKSFFITGLPRTRTAWLANFLTYDDSFCFHEVIKEFKVEDWKGLFESMGKEYVGNSDSGIPFLVDQIKAAFPQAKWVLIERDGSEAWRSLSKVIPWDLRKIVDKGVELTVPRLHQIKLACNPLIVKYQDLGNREVCKEIWNYCIPGISFNDKRWQMLDRLNVQVIVDEQYLSYIKGK